MNRQTFYSEIRRGSVASYCQAENLPAHRYLTSLKAYEVRACTGYLKSWNEKLSHKKRNIAEHSCLLVAAVKIPKKRSLMKVEFMPFLQF